VQVSDFQCIRPFELRGKWSPDHQHVSSSLSKIPYGGFSPVRLQTGIQPRPSSTMLSLSVRPAFPQPPWTYRRLKSLSPERALFRRGTFVQAELSLSYIDHPVQRSLASQRVMLSRQVIAYYDLIRASRSLPLVYVLSSRPLPYGLVWAGHEKVPNLKLPVFSHRAIFRTPAARRLQSVVTPSPPLAFPVFASGRRTHVHAWPVLAWFV
jgi:hypothetical protein